MKKLLLLLTAVLLCLTGSVLPGWAEEGTGRLLLIGEAAYHPETGILTISWTNTGSLSVTGAEIRINPRNAEGNPLVIGEGYIGEIILEERILHTSVPVGPGETVSVSFAAGADYPEAVSMDIAVDRIETTVFAEDGSVLESVTEELPDDRLCWYSTQQNAYTAGPENGEPYTAPADEVFELAAEVHIGFTALPVTGELAEAYGFAYSGIMITAVEEESPADLIGLEPGDLIYCVNGLYYPSEPYMMTLGAAALASGQPMTLLLERDNEFWELTTAPGAGD